MTTEEPTRTLVDVYAVAHQLGVQPGTVRSWVSRYGVPVRGRDRRGRSLYSLAELYDMTPAGRK
ncbi:MAG TPA: MerR family transcriptional regulator [Pseudonocardia sp.]